jgi:hypothetical protein
MEPLAPCCEVVLAHMALVRVCRPPSLSKKPPDLSVSGFPPSRAGFVRRAEPAGAPLALFSHLFLPRTS